MLFLVLALLLGSRDSTVDLPPLTCFHEHFRAGTGVPMSDQAAVKADRNLIVEVDQLIKGPGTPRKGTATSLGYILHIANGDLYYEPESNLTSTQQLSALSVLERSHAFATLNAKQASAFVSYGGRGIAKLAHYPTQGLTRGLQIKRCTTVRNPR